MDVRHTGRGEVTGRTAEREKTPLDSPGFDLDDSKLAVSQILDIEGIAGPVSHWVHTSKSPDDIARDAAEAVRQAGIGQIATLMLPADVSWGDNSNGAEAAVEVAPAAPVAPASDIGQGRLSSACG